MTIKIVDKNLWLRGDYRGAAALSLDIIYFENQLNCKSIEYVEDGLGPAKRILCQFKTIQFSILWLKHLSETRQDVQTTLEFLPPLQNRNSIFKEIALELNLKSNQITWLHEDIAN